MQFLDQKQRKFFSVDVKNNLNMSCVDKSQTCVHHVLKIVNFTNCHTWFFFDKYIRSGTQLFSFLSTRAIFKKIKCTHIQQQSLYQVFKTRNVCFTFECIYYCYISYVWSLIVVYQNNLWWVGLAASSYSPLLMIKVENTIDGNIEN